MMYELDKVQFGQFVAELRREKGYTQKQLAELLFISDKAVSKWERGLSLPDVSLLLPLAGALDVTATELLECRRLEMETQPDIDQMETLVKKAITFSSGDTLQQQKTRRKHNIIVFCACWAVTFLLMLATVFLFPGKNAFLPGSPTLILLTGIFGIYFSFFAEERLPGYYDENKINAYSHGAFRMNLPGVSFNNSNWPHILKAARTWCSYACIGIVLINLVLKTWFPELLGSLIVVQGILILFLLSLFLPMYIAAKKYE